MKKWLLQKFYCFTAGAKNSILLNKVTEEVIRWRKEDGVLSNGTKKIKVTDDNARRAGR